MLHELSFKKNYFSVYWETSKRKSCRMNVLHELLFIIIVFFGNLVNKTVENTIDGKPDPNADTNYGVEVYKIYKNVRILGLVRRLVCQQQVLPTKSFNNKN